MPYNVKLKRKSQAPVDDNKHIRHADDYELLEVIPFMKNPDSPTEQMAANKFMERFNEEINVDCYRFSAFRSSCSNRVFMFIQNEYVVISYDPESPSKDQLVCGPLMICDGFPEIYNTQFSESGVDFAFGCHDVDEAFLFSSLQCTKIKYSPIIFTGEVIIESISYKEMFPCLQEIKFGNPLYTAAFESAVTNEAYILYGSKYVLFNYSEKKLIATGLITELFPCLHKIFFTSEFEAAFASHERNQVYLFKGNSYVLIQYNPANADDSKIIFGPEEVVPTNWPSLSDFVPYKNIGFNSAEPRTWTPLWWSNGYIKAPLGGDVSEEIHEKYGPFAINVD